MSEGRKNDGDKLRWDLLPPRPMDELVGVYTMGAKKYADRNWENGLKWGRVFAALMRHAWAWWRGEQRDPVDGQHHLSSVAWCALALMEYEHTHTELDDRPKQETKREYVTLECAWCGSHCEFLAPGPQNGWSCIECQIFNWPAAEGGDRAQSGSPVPIDRGSTGQRGAVGWEAIRRHDGTNAVEGPGPVRL